MPGCQPPPSIFSPSATNRQLPRFVSQFWDLQAVGTNGLAAPLTGEIPYANPPFSLIPQLLRHFHACRARAYMLIPVWPDRPWYPTVKSLAAWRYKLPRGQPLFLHPDPAFPNQPPRWRSQLLFFDFS